MTKVVGFSPTDAEKLLQTLRKDGIPQLPTETPPIFHLREVDAVVTTSTLTARSGNLPGSGTCTSIYRTVSTTGAAFPYTVANIFSNEVASGTYCIIARMMGGTWCVIAADC